ncbi:MAG TPA: hypothetical protein VFT74_03045, partial [Isosphaeraceae bacterium]|nr:hypothetical protein [Isosphaeraceae bacterium]
MRAALNGQRAVQPAHARAERSFAGRLLSASAVESLPSTITEISISPETVLTPMARDLLKKRKIAVRLLGRAEARRQSGVGEWGFSVDSESWSATTLRRMLLTTEHWLDLGPDVLGPAVWVSEQDGRGAVLFRDQGALAVWQANRIEGVRAAAASDADGVSRAVASLGANLVVIEPTGKSVHELKHLASTFRKAGAPVVPEWISGETRHEDRRGDRPRDPVSDAPGPKMPALRDR